MYKPIASIDKIISRRSKRLAGGRWAGWWGHDLWRAEVGGKEGDGSFGWDDGRRWLRLEH